MFNMIEHANKVGFVHFVASWQIHVLTVAANTEVLKPYLDCATDSSLELSSFISGQRPLPQALLFLFPLAPVSVYRPFHTLLHRLLFLRHVHPMGSGPFLFSFL